MSRRRVIVAGGVVLATAALLAPIPTPTRAMQALCDAVHGPLFGWLALGCFWQLGRIRRVGLRALAAWLAVMGFGAVMELAQHFSGRSPSWEDLAANGLGALAGVSAAMAAGRPQRMIGAALATTAAVALGLSFYRPAEVFADMYRQRRTMPLLAGFESRAELAHWSFEHCRPALVDKFATEGKRALRIELEPAQYSGAALIWPPGDWSGYDELEMDVYLMPGPPLALLVKLEDRHHEAGAEDRYYRQFQLAPGPRTLRVPLAEVQTALAGRPFDLRRVALLQLFIVDLHKPRTLIVDNIRLLRHEGAGTRQPGPSGK